jgi:cyclohexyl-isocyanide hydratase
MTDAYDRRGMMQLIAGAAAAGAATAGSAQQPAAMDHPMPASTQLPGPRPKVAMLVYPRMVALDLVGPQTLFNIGQCDIHLVWKDKSPIPTDLFPITPTHSFVECPADLDVLFVPGGIMGTVACMNDPAVMAFLADRGSRAKWVTSVCTGGLVLGAAGLLRGYRANAFWPVRHLLPIMGAILDDGRVVTDRNRMTGGGVTAGIDFGLTLLAKLRGEAVARRAQLTIEYAPAPPYRSGTPAEAGEELTGSIRKSRVWMDESARTAAVAAARRLGIS